MAHAHNVLSYWSNYRRWGWSGSYYCSKIQCFDGSDHEHRKILIDKRVNMIWCIIRKLSPETNVFHIYIFLRWIFVQAMCHLANVPKSRLQKCGTSILSTCLYWLCERISMGECSTDWVFSLFSTERIEIAFQNSGITCISFFLFLICFASPDVGCYSSLRAEVVAGSGVSTW